MRTIAHRRALEAKVIDAARNAVAVAYYGSDVGLVTIKWHDFMPLTEAVHELDAAGLADPTNARSRGWPLTSVQAAAWMKGNFAGSVAAKIVGLLRRRPCTTEELCTVLNGKHQTISARVNELRDAGWLRATDRTRPTSSGMQAIVWELSADAWTQIREVEHGGD